MQCCERTPSDKKGGHLAQKVGGGLMLRESAQCSKEDEEKFQDITRHKFFNTNNLWIRLDVLLEVIKAQGEPPFNVWHSWHSHSITCVVEVSGCLVCRGLFGLAPHQE